MINLEIKLREADLDKVRRRAEASGARPTALLIQEDIFYAAPRGLLKLRLIEGEEAELIAYDRPRVSGSKVSNYSVHKVSDPRTLDEVLSRSLRRIGSVKKKRELWLLRGTRIHLDRVEGLGTFVELETEGNSRSEAATRAEHEEILAALQLDPKESLAMSYAEMLYTDLRPRKGAGQAL